MRIGSFSATKDNSDGSVWWVKTGTKRTIRDTQENVITDLLLDGSLTINGILTFLPTDSGSEVFNRREVDDADYTVLASDHYISVINLTASRTITLPNLVSDGQAFVVKDGSGLCGTWNIIVDCGADTIDGGATATMISNYTSLTFVYDGVSNYEIN